MRPQGQPMQEGISNQANTAGRTAVRPSESGVTASRGKFHAPTVTKVNEVEPQGLCVLRVAGGLALHPPAPSSPCWEEGVPAVGLHPLPALGGGRRAQRAGGRASTHTPYR